MKNKFHFVCLLLIGSLTLFGFGHQPGQSAKENRIEQGPDLFDSDEVMTLKISGKFRELMNDRDAPTPRYFPFNLSVTGANGQETIIPVQIKTRGHFRRMKENCTYPPLLIEFPADGAHKATVFRNQHKIKLVMPCAGDQYVIREWLVYRLYNLITPLSFKARLVKVQLDDERNKKPASPFFAILLEEEKQMAKRNGGTPVELKTRPQSTERSSFLTMAVFQYLIGNTDWSIEYLQNMKLVQSSPGAVLKAVAYDFDHSGLVSAPYANPAEALEMSSVRERRYRGYCLTDLNLFNPVIAVFQKAKNDIYQLYRDCKWVDEKYRSATLRYLDDFYATLDNPKSWQKAFAYPCDKNGTGNVVIKGLKED